MAAIIPDTKKIKLRERVGVRNLVARESRLRNRALAEVPRRTRPGDRDLRAGTRRFAALGWIDGLRKAFDDRSFLE